MFLKLAAAVPPLVLRGEFMSGDSVRGWIGSLRQANRFMTRRQVSDNHGFPIELGIGSVIVKLFPHKNDGCRQFSNAPCGGPQLDGRAGQFSDPQYRKTVHMIDSEECRDL